MGWSDWQDGFEFTTPSFFVDDDGTLTSSLRHISLQSVAGDFGFADFDAAIAAIPGYLTDAITTPQDPLGDVTGNGWMQLFQVDAFGGPIESDVRLMQWIATFATDRASFDLPIPPLPPDAADFEYEADDPTLLGWADWLLTQAADGYWANSYNFNHIDGDYTVIEWFDDWAPYQSFRVIDPTEFSYASLRAARNPDHSYPASAWPAAGIGTETDRVSPVLTTLNQTTTLAAAVSLAAVGATESFTALIQPGSMIDGGPMLHAPAPVPGEYSKFVEAADYNTNPSGFGPRPPNVRYKTPRWRYFINEAIYTVGGHWADPNGVQVKRLKDDGVTWIPIVDGLAPPLRP